MRALFHHKQIEYLISVSMGSQSSYVVALSFAGIDREFAEAVASRLRESGISVFYDKFEQHELWGKDLFATLRSVYVSQCRHVIMIISRAYLERMWPQFERQQIIEKLAIDHGSDAVLPVRLDGFDGDVPGLSRGIGYLAVSSSEAIIVADALLRKIREQRPDVAPGEAFERALRDLRKNDKGILSYDRTYTSMHAVQSEIPTVIGSEILGWLGNEFAWRRQAGEALSLHARNLALEETKNLGIVEICRFDAPHEWIGCGRWTIYWLPAKKSRGRKKETVADDELLIALYLYSQNAHDMERLLDTEELESAFLAAFFLKSENATRFYDVAERRFRTLR